MRKELDNTNELTYTLDEIEDRERLELDTLNTGKVNKHMQYIREQAIENLENWRKEFIINNHIPREDQVLVNRVFGFLKERA